jgi:hypothetical protein
VTWHFHCAVSTAAVYLNFWKRKAGSMINLLKRVVANEVALFIVNTVMRRKLTAAQMHVTRAQA